MPCPATDSERERDPEVDVAGQSEAATGEASGIAIAEAERTAWLKLEQELAEVRVRVKDELARAQALRLKAARTRRKLDAEMKHTRRDDWSRSQEAVEGARQQASTILEEARKSAEHIRRTARQAAESEVEALLADLAAARAAAAAIRFTQFEQHDEASKPTEVAVAPEPTVEPDRDEAPDVAPPPPLAERILGSALESVASTEPVAKAEVVLPGLTTRAEQEALAELEAIAANSWSTDVATLPEPPMAAWPEPVAVVMAPPQLESVGIVEGAVDDEAEPEPETALRPGAIVETVPGSVGEAIGQAAPTAETVELAEVVAEAVAEVVAEAVAEVVAKPESEVRSQSEAMAEDALSFAAPVAEAATEDKAETEPIAEATLVTTMALATEVAETAVDNEAEPEAEVPAQPEAVEVSQAVADDEAEPEAAAGEAIPAREPVAADAAIAEPVATVQPDPVEIESTSLQTAIAELEATPEPEPVIVIEPGSRIEYDARVEDADDHAADAEDEAELVSDSEGDANLRAESGHTAEQEAKVEYDSSTEQQDLELLDAHQLDDDIQLMRAYQVRTIDLTEIEDPPVRVVDLTRAYQLLVDSGAGGPGADEPGELDATDKAADLSEPVGRASTPVYELIGAADPAGLAVMPDPSGLDEQHAGNGHLSISIPPFATALPATFGSSAFSMMQAGLDVREESAAA